MVAAIFSASTPLKMPFCTNASIKALLSPVIFSVLAVVEATGIESIPACDFPVLNDNKAMIKPD
ncbi:MAG: hypothetical protein LBH01_04130 [Verrucomicrobiales bacterium]|nr:hypothetical protein [Verrucomicrobiales bacterium]